MIWENCDVSVMKDRVIKKIINDQNEELKFIMEDGDEYIMYHNQDCCESVSIDDICGDLDDLIGVPLLVSEDVSNDAKAPENPKNDDYRDDSETWTFYKFRTMKGDVTIRWYGSSNGYYSESVDFEKVKSND